MAQRRNTLWLLLALLLVLILAVCYLYLAKPAADRAAAKQIDIEFAQKETRLLQKKLQEKEAASHTGAVDGVQGELPYWDNTEQLVLDLERIGDGD